MTLENAAFVTKINHDHTFSIDPSVGRSPGQETVNNQPQNSVNYQPAVTYQPQTAINYQPQIAVTYQPQVAVTYRPQTAVNYQPQPYQTVPTLPPIQKTPAPVINYNQYNQPTESTCGVPIFVTPTTTGLIIKGKKAVRGQFPW